MTTKQVTSPVQPQPPQIGGLPVYTNLRAGLGWAEVSDQGQALWGKLTNAVAGATAALPSSNDTHMSAG